MGRLPRCYDSSGGRVPPVPSRGSSDGTWKIIARASNCPYPSDYTKATYRRLVEDSARDFPNGLRFTITGTTAEDDRVECAQDEERPVLGMGEHDRGGREEAQARDRADRLRRPDRGHAAALPGPGNRRRWSTRAKPAATGAGAGRRRG